MNERKYSLQRFLKLAKLFVSIQVSSAAIERVFSRLTFIHRAVGDNNNTCKDMMELRTSIRCNNGLGSNFEINGELANHTIHSNASNTNKHTSFNMA